MKTETSLNEPAQTMHPVELTPLQSQPSKEPVSAALRLAALSGVKAQVTVRAGHASTTVGELLNLKQGTVLQLDAELNAPFDILLNDTVVARGELVAVGEHFGICVTQVQHPGVPA